MKNKMNWISCLTLVGFLLAMVTPMLAASEPQQQGNSLININTADASQLDKLPRVGPKIAQRIIDYRKANGGFKRIQDIMKVKGIGEKTFEKMKNLITV